ncbi:sensor histidine kinase [uncultured Helicobacter sp.]|uniref:sensor histidine kinase n=1 Tax=uncultured Helicobacter sp. TaxID=175537 RepID=UPI00374E98B4
MFANSTKRTIVKILSLYLGTSLVLLCGLFYFVYKKETRNIYYEQVISLREVSLGIIEILKKYPDDLQRALTEIRESKSDIAFGIFDKRGEVVFSNLLANPTHEEFLEGFYKAGDKVVLDPEAFAHRHHKPTRFPYRIFIQDENVDSLIITNNIKLGVYFVLILLAMGIVAYFLVRLFLKPIHNHIQRLDSFIKDTTHEINTPISIILMSVEMLKTQALSFEDKKKITRIKLASLQLEHIYRTLVAYNFPHSLPQTKENLRLDSLLQERLEFFAPFLAQKSLTLHSDLAPTHLYANKEKIITLFDNLLSNAIKYNKHGGEIHIILREGYCAIRDSGSGIDSKHRAMIFERFARFDKSVGGFGIGLSLVREICKEYDIHIRVQSAQEARNQSSADKENIKADNADRGGSAFVLTWDLEMGGARADSH